MLIILKWINKRNKESILLQKLGCAVSIQICQSYTSANQEITAVASMKDLSLSIALVVWMRKGIIISHKGLTDLTRNRKKNGKNKWNRYMRLSKELMKILTTSTVKFYQFCQLSTKKRKFHLEVRKTSSKIRMPFKPLNKNVINIIKMTILTNL